VDLKERNRQVIEQFRAGGEIDGMHRDRILLLTTTGKRTGNAHTTPVMFVRNDDRLFVVAAAGGTPTHPDWYHNLVATPDVTVEIGHGRYEATATPLEGEDYRAQWENITSRYAFFAEYDEKLSRTIPVVELVRR
jgi:deazaflavin-dependent oxidoreductase (nitroreductase family)